MLKKSCHYATAAGPDVNPRPQQSVPSSSRAVAMRLFAFQFAFQDVIYNPPDGLG